MSEEVDAVGRAFGEREFPRKKSNARNAIPKSHEVDSDICAESLLELGTHFPAIRSIVLEKSVSCQYLHQTICCIFVLVCKVDLGSIASWEKSDLDHGQVNHQAIRPVPRTPTLCSIPARQRTVYAPREKPSKQILSPSR